MLLWILCLLISRHGRLGHVKFNSIKKMINLNLILKSSFDSSSRSEICVEDKYVRTLFHYIIRNSEPLELIHSDVCDSNCVLTRDGKRSFVTFINDYSKFYYTYLLKFKDEILDWFKVYKAEAENQLDKKIKILRSNHGGAYIKWHDRILPRARYYSLDNCSLYTSI